MDVQDVQTKRAATDGGRSFFVCTSTTHESPRTVDDRPLQVKAEHQWFIVNSSWL
jgi:hypothetical protein